MINTSTTTTTTTGGGGGGSSSSSSSSTDCFTIIYRTYEYNNFNNDTIYEKQTRGLLLSHGDQ